MSDKKNKEEEVMAEELVSEDPAPQKESIPQPSVEEVAIIDGADTR